ILQKYGDGVTMGIAVGADGKLYVGTRDGVQTFDPATNKFAQYSRDGDLRFGSLAFDNQGKLWAATWPDRATVIRFNAKARAEVMLRFDTPIDSIAFGKSDSPLKNLLFITHNSGEHGSDLTMVDVASLRQVAVATGGTRGDEIITTRDGRVLVSQTGQ